MVAMISLDQITNYILSEFKGLVPQETWGELTFFYNPEYVLPRGTYFCTLKSKDGENDKASQLDREDVYRLNFGLPPAAFIEHFGHKPSRPAKGQVIEGDWNFPQLDQMTPHPIYGWMGWVAVLNPSATTFDRCKPLMKLAYTKAVKTFQKRTCSSSD